MNQNEHLASLSRAGTSPGSGKRKNLGSLLLLLAFLAGVALVFVLVFGQRLQPRVQVTVASALLLESDEAAPVAAPDRLGSMLAQASGWIEPDPFPVRVPVQVDGFVESVLVYEGDGVEQGQLLATLDATNHTLRVEQLTASLEQARSDRAVAKAERAIAQARHHEAEDRLQRIRTLNPGDLSQVEVIAVERAEAETRSVVEARLAEEARQEARVAVIRTELAQAKVDLERTKIRAPMDGMVLRRFAAPGMKRVTRMDDPESATIVSLYDPERLQVRVDVPLSDAGYMVTGMPAKVVTAALAGRGFTGRVTRITGEADITRNTLQVKVALEQPDPALRPEMLCRVEFFASPSGASPSLARTRQVWLSEEALADGAEGSATVWVVDPVNETVSSREIQVAAGSRNGLRLVYSGLKPGEQVVVESKGRLESGTRVSVVRKSGQQI
jgi:RND family efflux transporter MFP subunit